MSKPLIIAGVVVGRIWQRKISVKDRKESKKKIASKLMDAAYPDVTKPGYTAEDADRDAARIIDLVMRKVKDG